MHSSASQAPSVHRLGLALALAALCAANAHGQTGYEPSVRVSEPTRLDWVFPVANQSPKAPPSDWLTDYDSTAQTYELFAPPRRDEQRPLPLALFVSPSAKAMGWKHWQKTCEMHGLAFAGPHQAGNGCPTIERARIVLDVLDDVRRRLPIAPDRTYIAGFSGGGRIACQIAFSLPECFGGAAPICAAGELREESWLRKRVRDRLSVALVTGETDFNRGEVERMRGPMLSECTDNSAESAIGTI